MPTLVKPKSIPKLRPLKIRTPQTEIQKNPKSEFQKPKSEKSEPIKTKLFPSFNAVKVIANDDFEQLVAFHAADDTSGAFEVGDVGRVA